MKDKHSIIIYALKDRLITITTPPPQDVASNAAIPLPSQLSTNYDNKISTALAVDLCQYPEDAIANRLKFYYTTKMVNKSSTKVFRMKDEGINSSWEKWGEQTMQTYRLTLYYSMMWM